MGVNGRDKGAKYERRVADLLSPWVGFKLVRTPGSGGWARSKERTDVSGDLVSGITGDDLGVCIECKCYDEDAWSWDNILKGSCKVLEWWMGQLRDESKGRPGLLIFKRNRTVDYVAMDDTIAELVERELPHMMFDAPSVVLPGIKTVVYLLSDFLARVPYPTFLEISSRLPKTE